MTTMYGGSASQGTPIGIILPDTNYPRIPGDVGNGFTYDFPVRFFVLKGFSPSLLRKADEEAISAICDGIEALKSEGCLAVALGFDGFLPYQQKLAALSGMPILASALLQASFAARMTNSGRKICILAEDSASVCVADCIGYGLEKDRILVAEMKKDGAFCKAFSENSESYVYEEVLQDVQKTVLSLVQEHDDIGAIICNSCAFAPFTPAINRAVARPVYDIVTLIHLASFGLLRGMTSPFKNQLNGGETVTPPGWGKPFEV